MVEKKLPFSKEFIEQVAREHPTPFHIYDEAAIRRNARALNEAFAWVPDTEGKPGGFRNFFAVKALPNPHVMRLLWEEGMGFDCSSGTELVLTEKLGVRGESIMFTSNDTPAEDYARAAELGGVINLDDISHIPYLHKHVGMPELISMRYNPGPLKEGNVIIGRPEEAKYGFTREQIIDGYRQARDLGAKRFALHTMVASNELNDDYFIETAQMLFDLVVEIYEELGIRMEFVNMGGGIGIPYHPEDEAVDYEYVSRGVKQAYENTIEANGLHPLRIVMENGRCITGPYGWLVSRVRHMKDTYKQYVGLEATMADLMRPGMYGAYHHITVLGKENVPATETYDVTGSLCENNDKFAIDRKLPPIKVGDLVAIHETGAHGYSMGFNYNGKLRHAELLLKPDGGVQQIRRAETTDDLLRTIEFDSLEPVSAATVGAR
ncbi:MAG: diaminopimelate decarboxylase [Spirochaetes bacterium]|jgi:diaminopimelate decarboxylase|nr:diaminopimelate decarboxylase [Spirochaetota bacterium]